MPVIVQICVVIVTLAIVALATTTILAMIRHGRAAARLTSAAQVWLAQTERVALETQELLASVREIMSPAKRVARRFERLGERAADLSTAVLDELEEPVYTAVAAARGVRAGTAHLLDLLTRRFVPSRTSTNGDQDHERQQAGE